MNVSIGAIGLGLLGQMECEHYDHFQDVDLVAGVDISGEARKSFEDTYDRPTYESCSALLDAHGDILDAVSIVTPHTLHYEQAMACLEAGLHVFVEKPLTTELDTATDLVETATERDRILQVGFQRHFDPVFTKLRELIKSGEIGDVHTVSCYLGQQWITDREGTWRTKPELSGGGQLFDSGTHLIDSMLWVLDAQPQSIAAVMDDYGHDVDVNSALAATLRSGEQRITASIGVSGDGIDPTPVEGLMMWGTDGHVSVSDGTLVVQDTDSTREIAVSEDRSFDALTEAKLRNFVDSVRGEADPAVTGEYGLAVTAFLETAYEAANSGTTVTVDQYAGGKHE